MEKAVKTLPKNRFELFKEIIKNQLSLLIKIGLLCFIIMLPLIVSFLLTNIKIYEINLLLNDNLITSEDAIKQNLGYINARNIIFLILIPLTLYFLSGIFNVIRKIVWREGVLFWYDYKKGLKDNGAYFFIIGLLLGIIFFVFNFSLKQEMINHTNSNFISLILSGVALLFLILFIPFLLHQTIIYNLKFIYKIKNTLIIFSKLFYIFIFLGFINVIFFLFIYINSGIFLLIYLVIACIIIMPLIIVINTLITDSTFDAFINHLHFKEIYRKGLYKYAENNDQ